MIIKKIPKLWFLSIKVTKRSVRKQATLLKSSMKSNGSRLIYIEDAGDAKGLEELRPGRVVVATQIEEILQDLRRERAALLHRPLFRRRNPVAAHPTDLPLLVLVVVTAHPAGVLPLSLPHRTRWAPKSVEFSLKNAIEIKAKEIKLWERRLGSRIANPRSRSGKRGSNWGFAREAGEMIGKERKERNFASREHYKGERVVPLPRSN